MSIFSPTQRWEEAAKATHVDGSSSYNTKILLEQITHQFREKLTRVIHGVWQKPEKSAVNIFCLLVAKLSACVLGIAQSKGKSSENSAEFLAENKPNHGVAKCLSYGETRIISARGIVHSGGSSHSVRCPRRGSWIIVFRREVSWAQAILMRILYKAAAPDCSPYLIAAAAILPSFMGVLDTAIASVALPHIAGSLSASTDA